MKVQNTFLFNLVLLLLFLPRASRAQDSLLIPLARQHMRLITYDHPTFSGEGWDYIKAGVESARNVMVGEDHFTREIPALVKAIFELTPFDNFYIEVDPYSTKIIERSLKELSAEARREFRTTYGELYSFYSLNTEYDLLESVVQNGVNLLGSDQIVMYADRLIFQDLLARSQNAKAKTIYARVMEQSRLHLEQFHKDKSKPMYFMTPEFSETLNELLAMKLSEEEVNILKDMQRSVDIYKNQDHRQRVRLLLHHLMEDYPRWQGARNLFKYGANHLARGESFLTVYDIGNLVANISAANFEDSFHIMVVGESGMVGSIFKSLPPNPVDTKNGFYQEYLQPFFRITEGRQWHMFNLLPLREALEKNTLQVGNRNLQRVIKGYDILIVIPEVSPAQFGK